MAIPPSALIPSFGIPPSLRSAYITKVVNAATLLLADIASVPGGPLLLAAIVSVLVAIGYIGSALIAQIRSILNSLATQLNLSISNQTLSYSITSGSGKVHIPSTFSTVPAILIENNLARSTIRFPLVMSWTVRNSSIQVIASPKTTITVPLPVNNTNLTLTRASSMLFERETNAVSTQLGLGIGPIIEFDSATLIGTSEGTTDMPAGTVILTFIPRVPVGRSVPFFLTFYW